MTKVTIARIAVLLTDERPKEENAKAPYYYIQTGSIYRTRRTMPLGIQ